MRDELPGLLFLIWFKLEAFEQVASAELAVRHVF
jgi:hypothetical protein